MLERRAKTQFPRTRDLPSQSSQYWCKEKDRYLRQLLISDIEDDTGRELVVYYSRVDQSISETDASDISEILQGVEGDKIDIMLETPGGYVDAVEKFITVLKYLKPDYRVLVPNLAKSGGTLIALASTQILMGVHSELGPVDPQIAHPDYGWVPAEYVSADKEQKLLSSIAQAMFDRSRSLAKKYLEDGMLKGNDKQIEEVLGKLSSATGYGSHGAVIDFREAKALGLRVEWMSPDSHLWKRVWLLHCLCQADAQSDDLGKIFEGSRFSISRKAAAE